MWERRTFTLRVRLTPLEAEALRKTAEERLQTLSQVAREALLNALTPEADIAYWKGIVAQHDDALKELRELKAAVGE